MFFKDIIGHQNIKDSLVQQVKDERVAHAYLFSGIEGVGTLPMAFAFAQYLNCLSPVDGDSCGVCSSCVKSAKLIHPDIHYVFPIVRDSNTVISDNYLKEWRNIVLSNPYFSYDKWIGSITSTKKSGVIYSEEANSIFRKLNLKNFEGKHKIMIVWLPERMNVVGANKILKILEEPPHSTVFIFVSENTSTLLPTIMSRLQHISFPAVDGEQIISFLTEKYSCNSDDAQFFARVSKGSVIRAIENVESQDDDTFYFDRFADMMRSCYSRKIFEVMRLIDELAPLSRDRLKEFIDYSINMLRESFIFNFENENIQFLNRKELEFVNRFARFINYDNSQLMVSQLELAYAHINQNVNVRIVLFDMMIKIIPLFKS